MAGNTNSSSSNRVITVINNILTAQDVQAGTLAGIETICRLYFFDRGRSYIRLPGTDEFSLIDEVNRGTDVFLANDIVEDKFTEGEQTKSQCAREFVAQLQKARFIHSDNYETYKNKLLSIDFTPSHGQKITEICIHSITAKDASTSAGYIVFERFGTSRDKLSQLEVFEIFNLCQIINNRIETFETARQLKIEEDSKSLDILTGLPVVSKFKVEAERLIQEGNQYALLYMDIDKFKYLNDLWSVSVGNDILQSMANIIRGFTSADEVCCRVSADKFMLLMRYYDDETLSETLDALNEYFIEMQRTQFCDIKITIVGGVYVIKERIPIDPAIDRANLARRNVKGSYKNEFCIYDDSLEKLSQREKQLEKRLSTALAQHQFIPYLQPKFNLMTKEICGAEALARWQSEDRMISPGEFIPLFEKNGFIVKLDFIIYEATLAFMRRIILNGHVPCRISMNVSRGHITDPHFVQRFMNLVFKYQVPTDFIELEITESIFMEDKDVLNTFISSIRGHGICVSIDDFGAAYSSLNLLKDIDVDVIKLDKAFIDNITTPRTDMLEKDKIIVKNIICMIKELEFITVFEGIEKEEQLDFLRYNGCDYGQGYLFDRPMSLAEFEAKFYPPITE